MSMNKSRLLFCPVNALILQFFHAYTIVTSEKLHKEGFKRRFDDQRQCSMFFTANLRLARNRNYLESLESITLHGRFEHSQRRVEAKKIAEMKTAFQCARCNKWTERS